MHTAAAVYDPDSPCLTHAGQCRPVVGDAKGTDKGRRLAVGLERPLDVPRRNAGRNQPIVAAPVVAETFKPDLKAALEFNPVVPTPLRDTAARPIILSNLTDYDLLIPVTKIGKMSEDTF
jgi:hypothetical protein